MLCVQHVLFCPLALWSRSPCDTAHVIVISVCLWTFPSHRQCLCLLKLPELSISWNIVLCSGIVCRVYIFGLRVWFAFALVMLHINYLKFCVNNRNFLRSCKSLFKPRAICYASSGLCILWINTSKKLYLKSKSCKFNFGSFRKFLG